LLRTRQQEEELQLCILVDATYLLKYNLKKLTKFEVLKKAMLWQIVTSKMHIIA
jgi:hypothetical protein